MGAFCSDCFKSFVTSSAGYTPIPDCNQANHPLQSTPNVCVNDSSTSVTTNRAAHTKEIEIPINNNSPKVDCVHSDLQKGGFFAKYDIKEEIGVGSTCVCYRCIRKADRMDFAVKVIDKRQIESKFIGLLDQFYVEIKILQELHHPNIISLHDLFETSDRIFIVMEYMRGGELFDYVVAKGTLNEEEASLIVRKVTSAIAHMHGKGIIHRDLKPENLLLTSTGPNSEIKLIDFGLAKIMDDVVATSFLGTRGYLAPEMLQRHSYDKAIDIWALGTIVFVLLCGCLPFDDDSSRIPSEHHARQKFVLRFPKWSSNLSDSAKNLLSHLLDVNPQTRYTADQALRHPWLTGKGITPNNYLQSPNLIGKRRKEASPKTPHMETMHTKLLEANAMSQLSSIKEEVRPALNDTMAISNVGIRRKNSL